MIEDKKEIQITVNKFIEIIYEMYMKDLKDGNISKDKAITSFGKICKKRNVLANHEEPNLFNYGK